MTPAQSSATQCADLNEDSDLAEIIEGLSQPQKTLSPKFFYDDRGSQLFDAITELPEYYLTNAELSIMRTHIDEIAALIGSQSSLIEFGSGSGVKTRILLENLHDLAAYVPVDISGDYLLAAADVLARDFPHIEILPVAADFTHPFQLPNPRVMPKRNIVYFPGSTIGNFLPEQAFSLLEVMYQEAGEDGALLIGVDLRKDTQIIKRAYNDDAGVTASFNLNMLRRLNREYGADFDLEKFEHKAVYDDEHGRIEMQLHSLADQTFKVGDEIFSMREGEIIITEHSHKYTLAGFESLAARAGFVVSKVWTDAENLFSVQYCVRT